MDEKNLNENNVEENVEETVETNEVEEQKVETTPEPEVQPTSEPQPTPQPQVEQNNNQAGYNQNANKPNTEGKATASMVCGIISVIPCCWGIVTLILGIIAVVLANQYTQMTGDVENSKAKAGKICGIIGIVGSAIGLIVSIAVLASGNFNGIQY